MRQHILVLFTSIRWIILEIKSQAGLSTGAAALIRQSKNVFSETSLEERRNQITPENQCILCFLKSLKVLFLGCTIYPSRRIRTWSVISDLLDIECYAATTLPFDC